MRSYSSPDAQLSELKIWVGSREFEDIHDYWDGNWLNVLIVCTAGRRSTKVSGAVLNVPEIADWLGRIEAVRAGRGTEAELTSLEPAVEIYVSPAAKDFTIRVMLKPSTHSAGRFEFHVDLRAIKAFSEGLAGILKRFPIRGRPDSRA